MNTKTYKQELVIHSADESMLVTVFYYFYKGQKACYHKRNGDPGFPAEEAGVEIQKVLNEDGDEIIVDDVLTAEQIYELETDIIINHSEERVRSWR